MTNKSLFKKVIGLFTANHRIKFGKNISVNEALNIQSLYNNNVCNDEELPNSPYVEIAKQLNSSQSEIFNAALYYLKKIAENESKNKNRIVELLKSIYRESSINESNKKLILKTIEELDGKTIE